MRTLIRFCDCRCTALLEAMVALAPTVQGADDFHALPRRRKLRLVWLFLRVLPYGAFVFIACTVRPSLQSELK